MADTKPNYEALHEEYMALAMSDSWEELPSRWKKYVDRYPNDFRVRHDYLGSLCLLREAKNSRGEDTSPITEEMRRHFDAAYALALSDDNPVDSRRTLIGVSVVLGDCDTTVALLGDCLTALEADSAGQPRLTDPGYGSDVVGTWKIALFAQERLPDCSDQIDSIATKILSCVPRHLSGDSAADVNGYYLPRAMLAACSEDWDSQVRIWKEAVFCYPRSDFARRKLEEAIERRAGRIPPGW